MSASKNLPVPIPARSGNLPVPIRLPVPIGPDLKQARAPRVGGWQRKASLLVSLCIAIGGAVGVSILLMPRGQEEALLRLEAGDAAGARELLERRYAEGQHSPGTVAALARARAETGDPAGAVALLEPLTQRGTRERSVVEALVTYRRRIPQDPAGLLRALLLLETYGSNPDRLREIAGLHGALGQTAEQRAVLRRLVDSGRGQRWDYLTLAELTAAQNDAAGALALMQRFAQTHPEAMDAHAAALTVSLHLENGDPRAAAASARLWLDAQPEAVALEAAPMLTSYLGAAGRPELAVLVLEPYAKPGAPPALILALAQAEIDAQREGSALARLEALPPGDGPAAIEVASLRLRLALAMGETQRAMAALDAIDHRYVSGDLVAALAAAAVDAGRADVLTRIEDWGGAAALQADPALATEAALLLGDLDAARRWSAAAGADVPTDPRRALGFAAALMQLDETDRATRLLAQVAERAALSPPLMAEVARRFVRIGRAEQGAALFARLRAEHPSPGADGAWLLAAAAVPARQRQVAAAIAAMTDPQPFPELLRDAMHLAADAGAPEAAIAAARALLAREKDDPHRMILARLLADAGRPVEALAVLREVAAPDGDTAALYDAALSAAWRGGDTAAREELRARWTTRLAGAADAEERELALAMLNELGAQSAALPTLREMALRDPERWLWTYSEAAAAADRANDATGLWIEMSSRSGLSPDFQRQLAFGLMQRGPRGRGAAEAVFRRLAAGAGPESTEVRQLLFIWGTRPAAPAMEWLETRARQAGAAEKIIWMKLLTERGGAVRAIAVYQAAGDGGPALWEAYATALAASNDRRRLAAAVQTELDRQPSADRLRRLVVLAGQSGNATLEERVLRALVLAGGGDGTMRRRVGLIAYRENDLALAERLLADEARDADTLFVLGEIRQRRGDAQGARRWYDAALRRVPAGAAGVEERRLQATLLRRLGRGREAVPIYEALLARDPGDRHLRADLASLLIEERNYGRAQQVLSGR